MKIKNFDVYNQTDRKIMAAILATFDDNGDDGSRPHEQHLNNNSPTTETTTKPPASLQIHNATTDAVNDAVDRSKGITVYTSAGNEAAAVASVQDVLALGETVEKVIVDELAADPKKVTTLPDETPAKAAPKDSDITTDEGITKAEEKAKKMAKAEKPKPKKAEKEPAKKPDNSEAGKKIRLLMLDACKLDGITIADVNNAIFEACDVTALREIDPDTQADTAIAAVQGLIDAAKGGNS